MPFLQLTPVLPAHRAYLRITTHFNTYLHREDSPYRTFTYGWPPRRGRDGIRPAPLLRFCRCRYLSLPLPTAGCLVDTDGAPAPRSLLLRWRKTAFRGNSTGNLNEQRTRRRSRDEQNGLVTGRWRRAWRRRGQMDWDIRMNAIRNAAARQGTPYHPTPLYRFRNLYYINRVRHRFAPYRAHRAKPDAFLRAPTLPLTGQFTSIGGIYRTTNWRVHLLFA